MGVYFIAKSADSSVLGRVSDELTAGSSDRGCLTELKFWLDNNDIMPCSSAMRHYGHYPTRQ